MGRIVRGRCIGGYGRMRIKRSERLAETLVMQAFLLEQRRSMRMDFRINGRPEKRTMRRACGLQSRCVGPWAVNGAGQTAAFAVHRREAGIMAWAANMPCVRIRFGRPLLRVFPARRTTAARPVIGRKSARRGVFSNGADKNRRRVRVS